MLWEIFAERNWFIWSLIIWIGQNSKALWTRPLINHSGPATMRPSKSDRMRHGSVNAGKWNRRDSRPLSDSSQRPPEISSGREEACRHLVVGITNPIPCWTRKESYDSKKESDPLASIDLLRRYSLIDPCWWIRSEAATILCGSFADHPYGPL